MVRVVVTSPVVTAASVEPRVMVTVVPSRVAETWLVSAS